LRWLIALFVVVSACQLMASPAHAACQVDTKPVAFGVVDVASRNDSNGEIVLNCSIATSFAIGLSGNGSPNERTMAGPNGGRLAYDLFTDRTRATRWGDGGGGGSEVTGSSDGENTSRFTIYGRVPSQNPVPPGTYNDVLTVSVVFF
jgi:spore coat protein U-like protein